MAIVSRKPLVTTQPLPNPVPVVKSQNVVNNVVDTKQTPLSHLVTHIEGSKWVVDLYLQVIDRDDPLTGLDSGQSGVYQQYKLVKGFELKVTNALSTSQNSETKSMSVVGAAHTHSLVIINHGDIFIADVGDGRAGIFQVTLSEKKSIFNDSVYYIEYALLYYVDQDQNKKADLDSKVVEVYYYLKDYLNYGEKPIVLESEYNNFLRLHDLTEDLINAYFNWFFSAEKKTFLVPGQESLTYDHYMTTFITKIIDSTDNHKIKHCRVYNVDEDVYLKEPTILEAIVKRDKYLLPMLNRKMGLVSIRSFSSDPMMEGIRFSGVTNIVYPSNPNPVFKSVSPPPPKTLSLTSLIAAPSRTGEVPTIITDNILGNNPSTVPAIKPILSDDYYIFSEQFYTQSMGGQSKLELFVNKFFLEQELNATDLVEIAKDFVNWGGLERFYYIPIIVAMSKFLFRGH
jgi:hypothetical protein